MKLIPLTQGYFVKVDDDDFDFLSQWKWHVHMDKKLGGTFYAKRKIWENKVSKDIRMHRVITNAPKELDVDHMDGDGLNNQKSNLRVCTKSENQRNQRPQKGTSSQYKGVQKSGKKWEAKIHVDNKVAWYKSFENEIEAAIARDKKAIELHGTFARLNFPPGTNE